MVRLSEGSAKGYYTTDGTTWQELPNIPCSGAKAAINQLEDGSYRILVSSSGKISYTDDFGKTWSTASTSDSLSSTIWMCVDEKNPQYVYAYGYYYNQYYFYSKPKADITDARYILMVSDDYGKTFKDAQTICQYDQCDNAYRIAYLDEGTFAIGCRLLRRISGNRLRQNCHQDGQRKLLARPWATALHRRKAIRTPCICTASRQTLIRKASIALPTAARPGYSSTRTTCTAVPATVTMLSAI